MAYFGNERIAPPGLFETCHEGPQAVTVWCKRQSDPTLTLALQAIHLPHTKVREVIQGEIKERRKGRKVRLVVIGISLGVLALLAVFLYL